MNEVEKLYRNCGIENYRLENYSGLVPDGYIIIDDENREGYVKEIVRDFTAEKQLEMVKFMLHKGIYYDTDGDTYWFHYTDEIENATYRPFEEAIAEFINDLWQDLTEEEKQQIKNILE
jgi:hypothetical protein